MRVKIFVAAHKPGRILQNQCLLPVQAGTALAGRRFAGMMHDDEGENISGKNRSYCELTVQYWAWKNQAADYYGFFHYRRYMDFTKEYPIQKGRGMPAARRWVPYRELDSAAAGLHGLKLEEGHIRRAVEKYDVITVLSERMPVTVYQQFGRFHNLEDLDCAAAVLKRRYPAYAHACDLYMHSKYIYFCNMYIMKRELFFGYMEWLFSILEEWERERQAAGRAGQRAAGYVAERLFGVYYTQLKLQGKYKCCELQYVVFRDMANGHKRKFPAGNTGWYFSVDMAAVNRLFPAGTLRRRVLWMLKEAACHAGSDV